MYLCDALDSVPYEDQQEQAFEGPGQQQQFEEGKWSFIILVVPEESLNTLYFIYVHESII